MKFCYVDESGTDQEKPYAIMAGVIVDHTRMQVTKNDWSDLLTVLSKLIGEHVEEIHTRDIYPGNGIWRKVNGPMRAKIFTAILEWFNGRKHEIVYSGVTKDLFNQEFPKEQFYNDVKTLWRFLALHICLSIQKHHQSSFDRNKGNTVLIFDEQKIERDNFTQLFVNLPNWTDTYYSRDVKNPQLDQIIDVPYFGDSKHVYLIQLADFVSFFLRRYVEIEMGSPADYENEPLLIKQWGETILQNSIPKRNIYLSRGRCECAALFCRYAPDCFAI